MLTRHTVGNDRSAAAAILRLIPTIPFEPQSGFRAVAGENVTIHLVETGVRQRIVEPPIKRRFGVIESKGPRSIVLGQRWFDRGARSRVESEPTTFGIAGDPRTLRPSLGLEPMNLATRDVAVKLAGICRAGIARSLPSRSMNEGIYGSRQWRDRHGCRGRVHGPVDTRH